MKRKTNSSHANGNGHDSTQALVAKAAATQKIADAARKHFKMLKAEYKQARKAFRQAKKAAKRARKEAEAAQELAAQKLAAARKPRRHVKSNTRSSQVRPVKQVRARRPRNPSAIP